MVLKSFLGPFFLTMLVVIFILLTQHMLKYFDDLVGKDLGWAVLGQLIFYFAIFVTPFSFPLAVLLSSLMTFGNLGEHSELTAIKSGGISLPRTMRSIFIFVLLITGFAFISNNYFFPRASLEAYSLLWDIKRKKPSLDLPEGEFYGGLDGYRIYVEKKENDGESLQGVIIYDHTDRAGNNEVTLADSGRITTIMNERYLKFELFQGYSYMEGYSNRENVSRSRSDLNQSFSKIKFDRSELIFDLKAFDLERTEKELFSRNRLMRNMGQITADVDSIARRIKKRRVDLFLVKSSLFTREFIDAGTSISLPTDLAGFKRELDSLETIRMYDKMRPEDIEKEKARKDSIMQVADSLRKVKEDSIRKQIDTVAYANRIRNTYPNAQGIPVDVAKSIQMPEELKVDSLDEPTYEMMRAEVLKMDTTTAYMSDIIDQSMQKIRQAKNRVYNDLDYVKRNDQEKRVFEIQYHKIMANSVACLVMFLIGAPLGSIIKKGGLGIPVLISILFFIIFYVFMIMGEKWVKSGLIDAWQGIWLANIILFPIGIFFLLQARRDARLFDSDWYLVIFEKLTRSKKAKGRS